MGKNKGWMEIILWTVIVILGLYIIYRGLIIMEKKGFFENNPVMEAVCERLEEGAAALYTPVLSFPLQEKKEKNSVVDSLTAMVNPALDYVYGQEEAGREETSTEETQTNGIEEVEKENRKVLEGAESENRQAREKESETQPGESPGETETQVEENQEENQVRQAYSALDYNSLLNSFYVLDPSTTTNSAQLDAAAFMEKDLTLTGDTSQPQILIYHTHSQEGFVDSVAGDPSTTIVGVGEYLASILREKYGYNVIHSTGVYDLVDGVLDRNIAYNFAAQDISRVLEENPGIQVVIDLHRDGVEQHFVTEIDGKPCAKIMFFNGLSMTASNGPIDYLYNPYIEDNLAFSYQLSVAAKEKYPDFVRCIYLQSLRYNLHLRPRALLVESGTHLNTLQEQKNAMEPLADMLNQVLQPK